MAKSYVSSDVVDAYSGVVVCFELRLCVSFPLGNIVAVNEYRFAVKDDGGGCFVDGLCFRKIWLDFVTFFFAPVGREDTMYFPSGSKK